MDAGKKPEKQNPRKGANLLSQLVFTWIVPFLWHGARYGLNNDDLTKCLRKDKSNILGNSLEEEWNKEVARAKRNKRDPKLRNAMFRLFAPNVILDGLLVFLFVLVRCLLPLVLGQLLLQFQKPILLDSTLAAANLTSSMTTSHPSINDTLPLTQQQSNRSIRSIPNYSQYRGNIFEGLNEENENSYHHLEALSDHASEGINLDDVRNTSIKDLLPEPLSRTDKEDELVLNITREEVEEFFQYAWNDIYWLSSAMVFLTLMGCIFYHHTDLRQRMVGAQMRIACCSLIYRKSLKLSAQSAGATGSGYLVNLLSNDVSRLDYGFIQAHYIWILPFQSMLICYLIWCRVGWASVVGVIGLLLKTVPVQTRLSRLSSSLRMKVAIRTDSRVGIMNELIQGIQVIKMYAWELPFQKVVAEARRLEVQQIRYASYLRGVNLSTMVFIERSTLLLAIAACVFFGESVSADVVFSMAQYFNILQLNAAIFYPMALAFGSEALVSIKRIEQFLLMQEKEETSLGLERKTSIILLDKAQNAVEMNNVTATWDTRQQKKTLNGINLKIKQGELCAIIGPVGAGKSSLLQLLLGEMPIKAGLATLFGSVSYACQKPWLFTGTVRSNILFGQIYDKRRYNDVVKCCALLKDFEQLPNGDKTIVGERGASLSGGQRARISLARAIYKQASIYLLDDPLSAVDAHVGKHLFDEVIGPRSRVAQNATRILVTHQVHFLQEADTVVIVENGRITRQGTYDELANSDLDFAKLLQRSDETAEEMDHADDEVNYEEDEVAHIDGENGYRALRRRSSSLTKSQSICSSQNLSVGPEVEEQAESKIPIRAFKKYFTAGGSALRLSFAVVVLIISQVVTNCSDLFVNYWTQQEYKRSQGQEVAYNTTTYLIIYTSLIGFVILVCVFRCYLFFNICMRASKKLHDRMFASVLRAPMHFFDTNPSGRILNRFSKDMGAIDEMLPRGMMDAIQITLIMSGILAMVLIVNPPMVLPLCGAIILFYGVIKLYTKPAQDMKRLEGISRSPVFSHLTATISGLSTIRARDIQLELADEFDNLQDVHSGIWQLTMSASAALGLWLDLISTAFIGCLTFSFIIFYGNTFSGNVGLAISQALILTGMVQYGIRQIADVMQQMTSVERIVQYADLDKEESPPMNPPLNWPGKGHIQFKNMSLWYDQNSGPVLKNLTIDIQSGWKVGIVGRTGAGKSSLISALFRLAKIDGAIIIDGIDTKTISLDSLRTNVSIIPQDPVLFSESIRYNLDPFRLYTDDAIWSALDEVKLRASIDGLNHMVTEGGTNFSVGQRQLICLARAILRNNKILVLDEATANVDPQTDALIQHTIRDKFRKCTVLTVAHRLHTVMDSDRILVMEAGSIREFDHPYTLLQIENSLLCDMVEATGPQEREMLRRMATVKYQQDEQSLQSISS